MNKKLFWIILLPCLLLIGGYLFIRLYIHRNLAGEKTLAASAANLPDSSSLKKASVLDLRPLFIQKLQQLLHKSSNGLYQLSVKDMKLDVLASTVSLQDVTISFNKDTLALLQKNFEAPNDVFNISFKELVVKGINLDDALTSKKMDYSVIRLVHPIIEIHHRKITAPPAKEANFPQAFLKEMEKLSIDSLLIEGATVIHFNDDKKGLQTKLNNFSVTMTDILIDSATRTAADRFLFSKNAVIAFKNFSTTSADGLYDFKIGGAVIKMPQQSIMVSNVSYIPKLSRAAIQAKFKFRKEIYNLVMPSISLEKMNWWDLLNQERLEAAAIAINRAKLQVYLDRTPPASSKMGSFPSQQIKKMALQMNIPKIKFQNMEVTYTEFNPKAGKAGTMVLDGINLVMNNVTNLPQKIAINKFMTVNGTANFMRKVPLKAMFKMDLKNADLGNFEAHLSVDGFEGTLPNSFAGPMGLINVKGGSVQKVDVTVVGDEKKATSKVLVLYKDLDVSLLQKDGDKALDKKSVISLLANVFVIKNNNPSGNNPPRVEQGEFKRNPNSGFLNLVWKTSLTGILKTIGAPVKLASVQ